MSSLASIAGRARSVLTILLAASSLAAAQTVPANQTWSELDRCSDVVIPSSRSFSLVSTNSWPHAPAGIVLVEVQAHVKILEQTASTTLELLLRNDGPQNSEAIVLLPVPEGAAVSSFELDGHAGESLARVLPRDEARRIYDQIVAKIRDPALLEFVGMNLVRSSVFPLAMHQTQRVRLTYEHLLEADGKRVDYLLPRSESLAARTPWRIDVDVRAQEPVACVYSPSHELEVKRVDAHHLDASLAPSSRLNPGPFRLSYLREGDGLSASLFAYPDPKVGGGYFLLMAGLPAACREAPRKLAREVTLVIDRSGSMAGPKMDQVRAAALQVVEGLADGEAFNLIDFSTNVSTFAPEPVKKRRETLLQARDYIAALKAGGGTNLYDALLEALRQPHDERMVPIVLFLTDGIPTVRQTSEVVIRELAEKCNPHRRRVFTFGVGNDVNAPLLDRIADVTRATTTYVLPGEDIEVKVGQVFERLWGPVLADVQVETLDGSGTPSTRLVRDLIPDQVPDRFAGDSVILLGQYTREGPIRFKISGSYLGERRTFEFSFDLARATTRNSFVPRLWATRRIAYLVDQVRSLGAQLGGFPPTGLPTTHDPRFAELTEEILRLSTEFGVLTEYTSFLATDGASLGNWRALSDACGSNLESKAIRERTGASGVAQGINFNARKDQACADYRNAYVDEKLGRVEIATVQQVCDRAFFQNRGVWVDSRLISGKQELAPEAVVEFGSEEHRRMIDALAREGRQGVLSLSGDILLEYQGKRVLVHNR